MIKDDNDHSREDELKNVSQDIPKRGWVQKDGVIQLLTMVDTSPLCILLSLLLYSTASSSTSDIKS